MNERELLELAAKAAGIQIVWSTVAEMSPRRVANGVVDSLWNPLADDGDAFRLAVKLRMPICFGQIEPNVSCWFEQERYGNGDPYAATRRAITRAAAEIGKEMK